MHAAWIPAARRRAAVALHALASLAAATALAVAGARPAGAQQQTGTITITFSATNGGGSARVTSTPAGIDCTLADATVSPLPTGACSVAFPAGTQVTLTATPFPSRGFATQIGGWNCTGGGCAGFGTTFVVTAPASGTTVVDVRLQEVSNTLVVGSNGVSSSRGSGRVTSSPAGIDCTLRMGAAPLSGIACSARFQPGASVTLTATPIPEGGQPSALVGWNGCSSAGPSCTVVMDRSRVEVTPVFGRPYTIAIVGEGAVINSVSRATCTRSASGTSGTCSGVTISGENLFTDAPPGWKSTGWSGGCTSVATNDASAYCFGAMGTVTATFVQTATRAVAVSVAGSGIVRSTVGPIACNEAGDFAGGRCNGTFPADVAVTLTAEPGPGASSFLGWSGACTGTGSCVLPPSAATQSVRATFGAPFSVGVTGSGSGTVTSSPAGIACTLTHGAPSGLCSAGFPIGTAVTLTATSGTVASWGGACAGAGTSCTVTLAGTGTANVAVAFAPAAGGALSVAVVGQGTVTGSQAGIACTGTGTSTIGTCTGATSGAAVTLSAVPAAGWQFQGWGGACAGASTSCTATGGAVTATFTQSTTTPATRAVSVTTVGSGTVVSTPAAIDCLTGGGVCGATIAAGAAVTLTATPASGWAFLGWGGTCAGPNGTCALPPSATPQSATATFGPVVQVAGSGAGSGRVTSTPAGIDCAIAAGAASGAGCVAGFVAGSVVTLAAAPAADGSRFAGWGGACTGTGTCQVTAGQAAAVTATFAPAPAVVVRASGGGSGRVTSAPAGIDCPVTDGATPSDPGGACRATFAPGSSVVLTAAPAAGQAFLGWSGVTCAGAAPGGAPAASCVVSLRDSAVVGVAFAALPAAAAAASDLLTGGTLGAAERAVLDQLGNRDGVYDLGDLLALLDRTGQRLGGDVLARVLALPAGLARPIADGAPRRP